ncbi:CDK5RAP3 isoform 26 [Pan troglodytes]|uniref:CDK5RAP3 isoform 26 n=1 Tax=Pan troglodytes TaxID=9598 RepID=A0A2J8J9C0_PANTR|nr:CDK5RAP3 isoform 26 [Pan troglodytes]
MEVWGQELGVLGTGRGPLTCVSGLPPGAAQPSPSLWPRSGPAGWWLGR